MNIFRKLFGPSVEELKEQLKEELENERIEKETLASKIAEEQRLAEEAHQRLVDEAAKKLREEKMNSNDPWVEMVGETVDPERGIKVELAWNSAFIKYLRDGGVPGASEEECAQRWLAMIAKDVDARHADDDNDGNENSQYQ